MLTTEKILVIAGQRYNFSEFHVILALDEEMVEVMLSMGDFLFYFCCFYISHEELC